MKAVLRATGIAALATGVLALSAAASETPQVSIDIATAVASTGAGKTVVAGLSRKGSRRVWAVVRYRSDGSLDPSFGSGGRALTDFSSGQAAAVVAQADGKILVGGAGDAGKRGQWGFALARYTTRGRLDGSFGRGGRVVTAFRLPPGEQYSVTRVASLTLLPDGKIVAAGTRAGVKRWSDLALVRYTARGRLDPTFGVAGKVASGLGPPYEQTLADAALQPDGKLVTVGSALIGGHAEFVTARFTAAGQLDPSFGERGRVYAAIGSWSDAKSVIIQADGKIVVGGSSRFGADSRFALVRYTSDGRLDGTFGTGGEVLTDVDPAHSCMPGADCADETLATLAIAADGEIVAAGAHDPYFAFARYTGDGRLDPTFGSGGTAVTDFGRDAHLNAAAIDPSEAIVAVGSSTGDFAVARLTGRGVVDGSFGNDGKVVTPFGPAWATKLESASAGRSRSGVVVRWRTRSEFDARGFYVIRETRAGRRSRVNRILMSAKGHGSGSAYSLRDRGSDRAVRGYLIQELTVDRNLRVLRRVRVSG